MMVKAHPDIAVIRLEWSGLCSIPVQGETREQGGA